MAEGKIVVNGSCIGDWRTKKPFGGNLRVPSRPTFCVLEDFLNEQNEPQTLSEHADIRRYMWQSVYQQWIRSVIWYRFLVQNNGIAYGKSTRRALVVNSPVATWNICTAVQFHTSLMGTSHPKTCEPRIVLHQHRQRVSSTERKSESICAHQLFFAFVLPRYPNNRVSSILVCGSVHVAKQLPN